jgi:anaerobic selenocysteine-containing dehydrogenase
MTYSISRRNFIKALGATSAATVLASAPGYSVFVKKAKAETGNDTGTQKLRSSCAICWSGNCGTIVTVKDGVVVGIEGDVDHIHSKGNLCGRGNTQLTMTYNPYRVKAPMKRTNPEKGCNIDPGWVEITWEEALDTVAAKYKEAAETDPRTMIFLTGFADRDYLFAGQPNQYFEHIFEHCNWLESNGPLCAIHTGAQMFFGAFAMNPLDITYCKYVLNFGAHLGPNHGCVTDHMWLVYDAYENGMKQYMIDPRCSTESNSGEWVPIKPATDFACLLGILNCMFYEIQVYDIQFLKDHTNSPYLIGEDGFYVRGENNKPLQWDLSDGKAKVFDDPNLIDPALEGEYTVNGKKAMPSFVLVRNSVKDFTPEWAEGISTVPAAKIREMAQGLVDNAHIGETITLDGVELPYRPVAVACSRGVSCHANGAHGDLTSKLIMALVGALDVPGSVQANWRCKSINFTRNPHIQKPNADGVIEPDYEFKPERAKNFTYPPQHFDLGEYYPHKHSMPSTAFKSILEPEKYGIPYEAKTYFSIGGNPIASATDNDLIEKALAKIPFTASIVYHYDEQAQMSDILLPKHSPVEALNVSVMPVANPQNMHSSITDDLLTVNTPAPAIYNTMHSAEITIQIIARMGKKWLGKLNTRLNEVCLGTRSPIAGKYALDTKTVYSFEEILDRGFKSLMGADKGLDFVMAQPHIPIYSHGQAGVYNYSHYPGRKTRYQIYFHTNLESGSYLIPKLREHNIDMGFDMDTMEKVYGPVLHWYDTPVLTAPKEYDLRAVNYKIQLSFFRFGSGDQSPWATGWADKYDPQFDAIQLNTATAKAKGFKEGDILVLESPQGAKIQGKLHITETCHPDAILVAGCMGRKSDVLGKKARGRIFFNRLFTSEPGTFDPLMGALETTVPVKVYKA